jgi:hypothetical protein
MSTTATTWPVQNTLSLPRVRVRALVTAAVVVAALAFRTTALSTYGFSEDEINKVNAIEAYRAGRFTANAEHPMLMKLTMWGSVDAAAAWNRIAPPDWQMSLETAIRLPNAIAGAATVLPIFGIADLLFGSSVAIVAATVWAFDVNAIAINRIGKEDTLLLLFFLIAVWCYERGKREGSLDAQRAQRWYTASGASFGLMLASKYMPHLLGVYALFNGLTDAEPGANRPNRLYHYSAMCAAFLAANPAVVLPATWQYCAAYVQGAMLQHHGYLYAGHLYLTSVPISPLGVPAGYYLRLMATKVPLAILAAAIPGVIEMVRRRRERGFVLLRVLAVFVLVPYSLMAAKFLRYSLPMLATLDLVAAVGFVSGISWLLRKRWLFATTRVATAAVATVAFGTALVAAQRSAGPFYSMFQNAIGARQAAPGTLFPEETYDFGVREAVSAIAAHASPSAVIVTDAPAVTAHYVRETGRPDLRVRSLSGEGLPVRSETGGEDEVWVIAQAEHTTFENQLILEQLYRSARPWRELYAGDALALQVFRLGGQQP